MPKCINNYENYVTTACIRALLILFNIGFWISGLSLIWTGIWMQTDFLYYLKVTSTYSEEAPFVLLLIGAVIVFATSLACSCIVKVQSSLLVVYSGFLITMLFSLISLSVYVYAYRDELLAGVSTGIDNQINNYNRSQTITSPAPSASTINGSNLIDIIQRNLECCGNKSYLDWPEDTIPKSCYREHKTSDNNTNLNVFEVGCADIVQNKINSQFTTVGISTTAIALFPLFGSILSFGLSMMYNKGRYEVII